MRVLLRSAHYATRNDARGRSFAGHLLASNIPTGNPRQEHTVKALIRVNDCTTIRIRPQATANYRHYININVSAGLFDVGRLKTRPRPGTRDQGPGTMDHGRWTMDDGAFA